MVLTLCCRKYFFALYIRFSYGSPIFYPIFTYCHLPRAVKRSERGRVRWVLYKDILITCDLLIACRVIGFMELVHYHQLCFLTLSLDEM